MGQARTRQQRGITLDAGALIALERGDGRMIALLSEASKQGKTFRIPAGVLAQVWRDGRRQAVLSRLLHAPEVNIVPLDTALARAAGELCGHRRTADMIDACLVLIARQTADVIVTSDPDDVRRLDARAAIVAI
jgi:predicted nucleic acid-binding protein